MTHTPGPWWVDEDGDYLCVCEGEVNDCGEREEIATLACNRPSHRHCQPDNARLIAAAPELLEMLRRGADAVGSVEADCDEHGIDCYPARHWWQDADRLIAKAEGRE
jgi:hypothetical protein